MSLEILVQKIRKEHVALLVGSGLSLYAGYKSAKELKEVICREAEKFCEDEEEKFSLRGKNLEEISDLLTRYAGSRNSLNNILVQEYKKKPQYTHVHDRLSRIPHFDHIFTTNYDTMLEDSMEKRCYVIGCTDHFPNQSSRFPKIYKLHGDVNNLNEVIITKRDYSSSIIGQKENLLWNRFKDVTSSKDILLLGHSFEDSNIWEIDSEVEKHLQDHRHGKYMVCPNLSKLQQKYLERIGFTYIDMTGEAFLDHLHPILVQHAIGDCEDQTLSLSTFRRFLDFYDKNVIIKTEEQKIRVEAILELDGSCHPEVNFTLSDALYRDLIKFNEGGIRTKSFKIAQKDLISFSMQMSGFTFPLDASKMDTLEVLHIPDEMKLDIESEDGLIEFNNLNVKRYPYQDGANLEFSINNSGFILSFEFGEDGIKVAFKFELPEQFDSVKEALEVLQFVIYFFEGKKMLFYLEKEKPLPIMNLKPLSVKFDNWNGGAVIKHLEQLRFLERKFQVKFSGITLEQMTEKIVHEVNFLYQIFSEGHVEQDLPQVIILPEQLRKYTSGEGPDHNPNKNLIIEVPKIYTFYGQDLPKLFSKIEVIDGEFIRHEAIFAIKSNVNKIRHKILLSDEYNLLRQEKNEMMQVEKFVKEIG